MSMRPRHSDPTVMVCRVPQLLDTSGHHIPANFSPGGRMTEVHWGLKHSCGQESLEVFSKFCLINEKISYFEVLGLMDLLQINLTILASEISLLFPRSGHRNMFTVS